MREETKSGGFLNFLKYFLGMSLAVSETNFLYRPVFVSVVTLTK